ncbi:LOW QUALITY PROTEIN: hypothetical protein Cgig2_027102 [Carnegiea gigantea]|uniref:Uncharacterized protein n=1 Tax=Carnegiea gigantea TaxID=171969 RepID=A0A9Q1KA88_9CARY|nr:LOW QUALITY PROTEIN: hypothetical protein Cgig2_027102 [Carnegiea gigantea]
MDYNALKVVESGLGTELCNSKTVFFLEAQELCAMHTLQGGNRVAVYDHGKVERRPNWRSLSSQELIKQIEGHTIWALGVVLLHGQVRILLDTLGPSLEEGSRNMQGGSCSRLKNKSSRGCKRTLHWMPKFNPYVFDGKHWNHDAGSYEPLKR